MPDTKNQLSTDVSNAKQIWHLLQCHSINGTVQSYVLFIFLHFLINFFSLLMIKYSSPLTHLPLSPSFSYLVYLFSHVSLSLFDLSVSKAFGYCSLSTDFLIKIPSPKLFSFGRCFGPFGLIDGDGSLSLFSLSLKWVVVTVNVVVILGFH